jgi:hypothetical protein
MAGHTAHRPHPALLPPSWDLTEALRVKGPPRAPPCRPGGAGLPLPPPPSKGGMPGRARPEAVACTMVDVVLGPEEDLWSASRSLRRVAAAASSASGSDLPAGTRRLGWHLLANECGDANNLRRTCAHSRNVAENPATSLTAQC